MIRILSQSKTNVNANYSLMDVTSSQLILRFLSLCLFCAGIFFLFFFCFVCFFVRWLYMSLIWWSCDQGIVFDSKCKMKISWKLYISLCVNILFLFLPPPGITKAMMLATRSICILGRVHFLSIEHFTSFVFLADPVEYEKWFVIDIVCVCLRS